MAMNDCRQTRPRSGTILVVVLLGLLVVMLFGLTLTKAVVTHHRHKRISSFQAQSFWLAESAVQRAVRSLSKSPEYKGETWRLPADVLGGQHAGVATILVETVTEPAVGRLIRVEAVYPEAPVRRVVHKRELFVNLSSRGGSS
jgi:hypothetical protein